MSRWLCSGRVSRRMVKAWPSVVGSRTVHHLVSGKLTAQGFPRSVDTLFQEGALDADQQVIGQHTEEDVGFNPSLQMIGATGSRGHRALRASSRLISLSLTYRWVSSRFKIEGVSHGGHGGHGGFLNR